MAHCRQLCSKVRLGRNGRGWEYSLRALHKSHTDFLPALPPTTSMLYSPPKVFLLGCWPHLHTPGLPTPPWDRASPEFVIRGIFLTSWKPSTIRECSFVKVPTQEKIGLESLGCKKKVKKALRKLIQTNNGDYALSKENINNVSHILN